MERLRRRPVAAVLSRVSPKSSYNRGEMSTAGCPGMRSEPAMGSQANTRQAFSAGHQAAAFRCSRCWRLRSFLQAPLQVMASGFLECRRPQTTHALSTLGCASRYSARRWALYSATASAFSSRHARAEALTHFLHLPTTSSRNSSAGSQSRQEQHHCRPSVVIQTSPSRGVDVPAPLEIVSRKMLEKGSRPS
jgi:hypothetical protein